jgi:hypothetical protein
MVIDDVTNNVIVNDTVNTIPDIHNQSKNF